MASRPGEKSSSGSPLNTEPELRLLLQLEPRYRAFFGNLLWCLRRPRTVWSTSPPSKFWTDVFVPDGIPWGRVAESVILHVLAVVAVITISDAVRMLVPRAPEVRLNNRIYHYEASNYLPPLDTGSPPALKPRTGKPLIAKQKIISLRPRPDNFEQTIISPVDVKLPTTIELPNIVAWTERPAVPSSAVTRTPAQLALPHVPLDVIAPAPKALSRDIAQLNVPVSPTQIIEPPPSPENLRSNRRLDVAANIIEPPPDVRLNPRAMNAPPPSVIEPPPSANVPRNIGTMNIGHLAPTVAAPKLTPAPQVITLQRGSALRGLAGKGASATPAAPPIAPVGAIQTGVDAGQLIALNLRPSIPSAPPSIPPGRRSGEFAVGPDGTANAPGTPEIKGGGNGTGGERRSTDRSLPAGITVGNPPEVPRAGPADNPSQRDTSRDKQILMAATRAPRVGEIPRTATASSATLPDVPRIEDRIFGSKRVYTLALNTPNLTSSGGSWVIRFAQLDDDRTPAPLNAPVATRTVDPAYPPELIRDGLEGTVILYAIIHKDGTIGGIRVLRGIQARLDENAQLALSRWKFRPGTRNGQAVDVEAVVQIPFKAARVVY